MGTVHDCSAPSSCSSSGRRSLLIGSGVAIASIAAGVASAWQSARHNSQGLGTVAVLLLLAGLVGLLAAGTVALRWDNERTGEAAWRAVCPALGEAHTHDGEVLRGKWKGRFFRAAAHTAGPSFDSSSYSLTVDAEGIGPSGRLTRASGRRSGLGPSSWKVRCLTPGAEKQLVEAGLVRVVEEAERRAIGAFSEDARVSYNSRKSELKYTDNSGAPPSPHAFVVQLEVLRQAAELLSTTASSSAQNER